MSISVVRENQSETAAITRSGATSPARPHAKLPRVLRLNKNAVTAVLKYGKKIRFALKTQPQLPDQTIQIKQSKAAAPKFSVKVHVPKRQYANVAAGDTHAADRESVVSSRIATAVPKRLLKSAVSRNAVKRWIREAFRVHAVRENAVDMLITLESKLNLKSDFDRQAARQELQRLFTEVVRRMPATLPPQISS